MALGQPSTLRNIEGGPTRLFLENIAYRDLGGALQGGVGCGFKLHSCDIVRIVKWDLCAGCWGRLRLGWGEPSSRSRRSSGGRRGGGPHVRRQRQPRREIRRGPKLRLIRPRILLRVGVPSLSRLTQQQPV
eukprot:9473688-Pyramimonas_sp.AAC.1